MYSKGDIINLKDDWKNIYICLILNDGIEDDDFLQQYMGKRIEYMQHGLDHTNSILIRPLWHRSDIKQVYYSILIGDIKGWFSLENLNEYNHDMR